MAERRLLGVRVWNMIFFYSQGCTLGYDPPSSRIGGTTADKYWTPFSRRRHRLLLRRRLGVPLLLLNNYSHKIEENQIFELEPK